MKCAYVVEPYKVELKDIEKPAIGNNDVLVKICYAGVCGSDLLLFKGLHAFRRLPCILGHEQAGIVCEIGKNVTKVKVGDRVTVNPQVICGKCEPCKRGLSNLCDNRKAPGTKDWIGTFAEYFPASEDAVYKLADHISLKAAVMTEPLAVSHHLLKLGHIKGGKTMAILGSGTVGLTTLFLAKRSGYEKILCTDLSEGNVEIAKSFGATVSVNPQTTDIIADARKMTGGEGVDLCVVTGIAENILDEAVQITRKGGDICLTSMITTALPFHFYEFERREQHMYGNFVYTTEEFEETMDIVNNCSSEELEQFITHVIPFADTQYALEILNQKLAPTIKVLVKLQDE